MSHEPKTVRKRTTVSSYLQNTILAGFLTAVPLVVTWFILAFLFRLTAAAGRPAIAFFTDHIIYPNFPGTAQLLGRPLIENGLSFLFVITGLFLLGFLTRRVIGRRLFNLFNRIVDRIPFANKVYGAVRQLVDVLQNAPNGGQRVVMIEFPSPEMKAVGLVMRTMIDRDTGEELAAVYVPTTPNPTNGYLEVVPTSRLVSAGMSMDDAMSFIISGGAVGPTHVHYRKSAPEPKPEGDEGRV